MRNRGTAESLEVKAKNMAMVIGSARYCTAKATTCVAREWYAGLSKAANRRVQDLNRAMRYASESRNLLAPNFAEQYERFVAENGKGRASSSKLEHDTTARQSEPGYEQPGQYPEQNSPGIQEIAEERNKDATDTSEHAPGSKDNDNAVYKKVEDSYV